MRSRKEMRSLGARFSHPLLALLTAAIAAVGAIAQCGLLIDSAASAQDVPGMTGFAVTVAADQPVAGPRATATRSGAPLRDAASLN